MATLLFWQEDHMAQVIKRLQPSTDSFQQRCLLCYQLHCGLQELYMSTEGAVPVDLSWLMNRCIEITEIARKLDI